VVNGTAMHPASEREYLLVLAGQTETLKRTIDALTATQERYATDMISLRERVDSLRDRVDSVTTQLRVLVGVLLFVVTPVYGASIWSVVAHALGSAKP